MTVFTSCVRPLRLAVSVVTLIVLVAVMFAPLSAAEPAAGDPEPGTGGVIIEAVEAGVWKVVSDGAGHALFGSDDSITFDPDGRAVMCCDARRAAGEEVELVFRFGEPDPIAAIGPEVYAPYPRQLHVDAEGALWLGGLVFDGQGWSPTTKRLRDADRYYHLPDGTVWAGLRLFDGGPTVARLADGAWTRFTDETGFPRLAGDWGEIADVAQTPDGSVWVAVRGMQPKKPGGLARFDGESWQVQHPLGRDRKARAEAIAVAPDGSLWVYLVSRSGGTQLARFDGESWTVLGEADGVPPTTSADDYAPLFMEFSGDGTLWLTPRVGWECSELDSFDGSTWTTHLGGACVNSLAVAPDGAAWASAAWRDEDGGGGSGLYVIPPGDATDYFAGATQVERPASEEEALLADVRIACVSEAPNDDARALCDLIAPLTAEALRVAVDACGGSDPETDGQAMCLGFFAPMLASSMKPPPWREGMDVEVAAAYLEASAPYESPADEALAIGGLPGEEQESAWSAAAERDAGFATALEDLDLPGSLDILVADAADRWRDLAATERALAADPSARSALEDYVSALASAQVAESELRWLVGLPPRASTAMATMSELTFEMPQGPPVSGKPVGVLVEGRSGHAAARLDDGRILLSGGYKADVPSQDHLASAEVYDPADGRFTDAGRLKSRRAGHWALPLSDGTVLIIGGGPEQPSTSVESFDPATGTSKRLKGPRGLYQVDLVSVLEDGRVLVLGPTQGTAVSAWLLDPASGEFTATGSPLEPRDGGTATLLADGTVLLVGGVGDYFTNQAESAELFDPATGEFASLGRPLRDRAEHTATRLADGRVLIAGGTSGVNGLASAELYDPATRSFLPAGTLRQVRYGHQATALDDGRVLITGGSGLAFFEGNRSVEVYDPATGRFEHIGWFTEPREGETAVLLDDGRVLITGGGRAGGATAEIFDPATGESTAMAQPT